ncbi:MAG TPA: glutamine amidotransferase [Anaeromyxobacter sp.]|nr:glutamine amidotransferase [Anaeromyxobacter sp.]
MQRVLVVKTGSVSPSVRVALGDYDRWFVRTLAPSQARLQVVEPHLGQALPGRVRDWDAVLVTGSPHSVTESTEWIRRTGGWLRESAEQRVPVLGVCFGHQLLAWAYGATIRRSLRGREIGTITCALSDAGRADPLFEGVGATFDVQSTHEDEVVDAPAELELLAASGHTANQAFRVGRWARAVQFHPEIDTAAMRAIVETRIPALEAEARALGLDPTDRVRALLAGIRPAPAGPRILENFLSRVV